VVYPDFAAKAFPPTACIGRPEVGEKYRQPLIAERFGALLELAIAGKFPAGKAGVAPDDAPSPWAG
jgi:hypothetical protein